MIDIKMPQLGESVTEGTITSWLKKPGDAIAKDELVCEVSTDKATFEVPATHAGVLTDILASAGAVVQVGATIARLTASPSKQHTATSAATAPPNELSSAAIAPQSMAPTAPAGPTPLATVTGSNRRSANGAPLSPVVRRLARENNLDVANLLGTGEGGRVTRRDVEQAAALRATTQPAQSRLGRRTASAFRVQPMAGDDRIPFSPCG